MYGYFPPNRYIRKINEIHKKKNDKAAQLCLRDISLFLMFIYYVAYLSFHSDISDRRLCFQMPIAGLPRSSKASANHLPNPFTPFRLERLSRRRIDRRATRTPISTRIHAHSQRVARKSRMLVTRAMRREEGETPQASMVTVARYG